MKRVNFKMKENIKFLILYSSVFKGISYAKMEFIFFFHYTYKEVFPDGIFLRKVTYAIKE